jgi:proline dehydrogenase
MMRSLILWLSRSRFLERQVRRRRFVRRAVRRFMPGEELDDALGAAQPLGRRGLGVVLTQLGENVDEAAAAEAVARHYNGALDRVAAFKLDAEISVKPTQLGLDLGMDVAVANLLPLVRKADQLDTTVWLDMEDSSYVDRTLELVRVARRESPRVGVCLQAYLHRTPADLAALMDPPTRVRLVKGAYRERASVALTSRKAVDVRFVELGLQMLRNRDYVRAATPVFGTHDDQLIERVREYGRQHRVNPRHMEFHLLYGIRTDLQEWLAAVGATVSVLISYGDHWFPWYMRRMAERPANLWFVAQQVFGRSAR